jgi:predicted lipoprotein
VVFRLTGCSTEPAPNPQDGFDRAEMLASTTDGAILPTYSDFAEQAVALQGAAGAWLAARESGADGEDERALAQEAWRTAMTAWQRAEVMQLGPAGAEGEFTGAEGLRDAIYSWPSVNPCRVDQEIVEQAWGDADFFDVNLVNVTGLDALEYLLFVGGNDNSCAPQVAINDDGLWAAIPSDEVDDRRASFSLTLSTDLVSSADRLLAAWTDGFAADLAGAGEEDSSFLDQSAAMDDLFASLFYLELTLKDRKLGQPLGLIDCSTTTCPDAFESPHADFALDAARANLEGGLLLYLGGSGEGDSGLEELLIHNNYQDLDAEIQEAFSGSLVAIDAVPSSALLQLEQDSGPLMAVHTAVKELTDLLKGDMATALLLAIPGEAANDND